MRARHHPIFARLYGHFAPQAEHAGVAQHRQELLGGLSGRVVEVGAGSGLTFSHYPPEVTEVAALEPEPYLRHLALQAARDAPVPVVMVDGSAEHIPAGDGSFDAAVTSLVLCSVPDQARALAELRRVLRPGGQLRFYEHVRSEDPRAARAQDRIDHFWPLVGGGCHPNRDTPSAIAAAGFDIETCRRFEFRPCLLAAPVAPHVVGMARRP